MAEESKRLVGLLKLEGIEFFLKLGALPSEQIEPRKVLINLEWDGLIYADGEPFLDYSVVCNLLKQSLKPSYRFIEGLALDIMEILEEHWTGSWKVTVVKLHPLTQPPMKSARVTIANC